MIPSELRPTYKLRTNIRPVRHAYLISFTSRHQLETVMSYCCSQWGGIANLIVPVERDLTIPSLHEHLLTLLEPDVIVSFLPTNSDRTQRRHDRLETRLRALLPERDVRLATEEFREHDRAAHPLSIISEEDRPDRDFLDRRFLGRRSDHLSLLAMFGEIYPGQHNEYANRLRLARLDAGLDSLDLWSQQTNADPLHSPINLTGYGVNPYRVVGSLLGPEAYF